MLAKKCLGVSLQKSDVNCILLHFTRIADALISSLHLSFCKRRAGPLTGSGQLKVQQLYARKSRPVVSSAVTCQKATWGLRVGVLINYG